jgi:hypothetical protein
MLLDGVEIDFGLGQEIVDLQKDERDSHTGHKRKGVQL